MHGIATPLQTRYGVALAVMEKMGWTYDELCDQPHDLVEELITRIGAENEWRKNKADWDESRRKSGQK